MAQLALFHTYHAIPTALSLENGQGFQQQQRLLSMWTCAQSVSKRAFFYFSSNASTGRNKSRLLSLAFFWLSRRRCRKVLSFPRLGEPDRTTACKGYRMQVLRNTSWKMGLVKHKHDCPNLILKGSTSPLNRAVKKRAPWPWLNIVGALFSFWFAEIDFILFGDLQYTMAVINNLYSCLK